MTYRFELFVHVETVYDQVLNLWSKLTPFRGWCGSPVAKNFYVAIRHEYLHIEKLRLQGLETSQLKQLAKDLIVLGNVIAYSYNVYTTSELPAGQIQAGITALLDDIEELQIFMENNP
jgi:hypothetical protein